MQFYVTGPFKFQVKISLNADFKEIYSDDSNPKTIQLKMEIRASVSIVMKRLDGQTDDINTKNPQILTDEKEVDFFIFDHYLSATQLNI